MQVALLIVIAWGLDALFSLRALQLPYFAYTDPLLILAAVLVVTQWRDLLARRLAQNAAVGLLVVYVVWGHFEPFKAAYLRRGGPQEACVWLPVHVTRITFPFCRV